MIANSAISTVAVHISAKTEYILGNQHKPADQTRTRLEEHSGGRGSTETYPENITEDPRWQKHRTEVQYK
jgi:hypothetical protein